MSQGMSRQTQLISIQLAFSRVLQERGKILLFCFIFNNSNKKSSQVTEQILWFISKCQSTERKRPFSLELFKLNKYSSLDEGGVPLIRTGMHLDGLHGLFKPRDFNTLEEARKWGNNR